MSNQPAPINDVDVAGALPSPPSPCINVCLINSATGLCEGCHRDIDEIIQWSSASDAEKRQLLQQLLQRRNGSVAV